MNKVEVTDLLVASLEPENSKLYLWFVHKC